MPPNSGKPWLRCLAFGKRLGECAGHDPVAGLIDVVEYRAVAGELAGCRVAERLEFKRGGDGGRHAGFLRGRPAAVASFVESGLRVFVLASGPFPADVSSGTGGVSTIHPASVNGGSL
jgi:hypothetical protein